MISLTQLEVRQPANPELPPIYLGPFDEQALATVMPIDPESARYERKVTVGNLITATPEAITEATDRLPSTNTFGVYSGGMEPDQFTGIVELTRAPTTRIVGGELTYTRRVQALGIHIYRAGQQRHGLGTAAVVAAMRYGLHIEQAGVFNAWTSEKNTPMQCILDKAGFVKTGASERIKHYDGSKTSLEQWKFVIPELVQRNATAPPAFREKLLQGYEKFTALAMNYSVRIV